MISYSFTDHPQLTLLIELTRRDETVIRLHTRSRATIAHSGDTFYCWPGMRAGTKTERNDGTPPSFSLSFTARRSGLINFGDLDAAEFEGCGILVDIIDAAQATPDRYFWFDGVLGKVQHGLNGTVLFETDSKFALPRDVTVHQYNTECYARFGDPRTCKQPTWPVFDPASRDLKDLERSETIAVGDRRRFRFDTDATPEDYRNAYLECTAITTGITSGSAPTISETPGDTSTDGGVTWTTRNALVHYARVASLINETSFILDSVPDTRAEDDTYYVPGKLRMASGTSRNRVGRITAWDHTSKVVEFEQPFGGYVSVNDWLEIATDCDQLMETCFNKHSNLPNFRGWRHYAGAGPVNTTVIPGMTTFPDIGGGEEEFEAQSVEFPPDLD